MAISLTDLFANVEYLFNGRLFPGNLPEGSIYPAAAYNVVGGMSGRNLSSLSGNENLIVQVDIFGEDYGIVETISNDMIDALHNGDGIRGLHLSKRTSFEPFQNLHRFSLDFSVWIRRG